MSTEAPSTRRHWATWLINGRGLFFGLAVVATYFLWEPAARLKSDQSVEALFARHDPQVQAFLKSQAMFGGDELAFFCYTDPQLNTPAGMSRLRNLSQELGEVPGLPTESVQDLATSLDQAKLPFINIPPEKFRDLTHRVLIGDDEITTAIVLRFAPLNADAVATGEKRTEVVLATVPRSETVKKVREIAARHFQEHGLETHLVGEPVQELDAMTYVEDDDKWLWIYAAGLLQLILLYYYGPVRWLFAPSAVAFAALVWTRAILAYYGVRLGMISSMLTPVLTTIGIAFVIPMMANFRERHRSTDAWTALQATFRELMPTSICGTVVVAIGSLALLTNQTYSLAEFGWMIAIGTLLLLPAIVCILPLGILLGSGKAPVESARATGILSKTLSRISRLIETAPGGIAILLVALFAVALAGCSRLSIETDFIKNFRPSSPIAIGLDFVERHFGGSATWEVNFPTPDEMTEEFLQQVEKLANELRQLQVRGRPALTKVICLADGEAIVPRTFFTSQLSRRLWLLDKLQAEYVSTLYNAEEKKMRLILRSLERQTSSEKLEIIRHVTETTRKHFPEAQATGIFVLLTFLIEHLLRDLWISLAISAAGIVVVAGVASRRISFALFCLLPNLWALILVIGTMGWLGLPINIAEGMLASLLVSLMSVSSMHYLFAYQRARNRGLEIPEALAETHLQSGRVCVLSNIVLMAGLLVLLNSHFIPVIYFGNMASVTLFAGLVGNLCMLPLLLRWTENRKTPSVIHSEG